MKSNESGLVRRSGLIKNPNWDLTAGQVYYLGLDGNISNKASKKNKLISVYFQL